MYRGRNLRVGMAYIYDVRPLMCQATALRTLVTQAFFSSVITVPWY